MNTKRMQAIASDIDAISTARFYLCNGWGIIGFKSDTAYIANKSGIRRTDGRTDGSAALDLIKKLNNAIQSILEAEVRQLQAEFKQMTTEEK